eukprot:snap_masked-scaffold_1-processed-gene-28.21-mRNA-1 protein AED:1.00 eAED:1.00 QI:0/0/0/0/1/1/2/0/59
MENVVPHTGLHRRKPLSKKKLQIAFIREGINKTKNFGYQYECKYCLRWLVEEAFLEKMR